MASDLNSVTIVGRLTRDAELKTTNSGVAICNFSIANGRSRKKGDEWVEETSFFDAFLIGRRAEALHKYLVKGKQVGIAGSLQQDRWEKDGQKRSRVKIVVDDLQLFGGKSDGSRAAPRNADAVSEKPYGTEPGDAGFDGADFESDIPF